MNIREGLKEKEMRTTLTLGALLLGLLFTGPLATGAAQATATDTPRVALAVGPVEIGTGTPPVWRPAHGGELLAGGDSIRTGHDGRAEIALGSGTVRVYENSLLRLPDDAVRNGQAESIELQEGGSIFDILKRAMGQDQFEVRTPEAVVMVKGTRFSVALDGGSVAVSVFRGLVGVTSLSQKLRHQVLVRPGFTASGGRALPLKLELDRAPDPWGAWGEASRLPKREVRQTPPASAAIDQARRAAIESLDLRQIKTPKASARPRLKGRQGVKAARLRRRALEHAPTLGDLGGNANPVASSTPDTSGDVPSTTSVQTDTFASGPGTGVRFSQDGTLVGELDNTQVTQILTGPGGSGWAGAGALWLRNDLQARGIANPTDLIRLVTGTP